jgi:cellobiose phosphorylase
MKAPGPIRLASPSGLSVQVNANGSILRIDHRDAIVNAWLGNELEGGPANLHLRLHGERVASTPLLGPRSPGAASIDERSFEVAGEWSGIRFRASLRLAEAAPAWFWHVWLENTGPAAATLDLVHAQDVALSDYNAVRLNEYYVSQYVDHTPLVHPVRGCLLAVRQNLAVGSRFPWALFGSLGRGVGFATDALSLHGLAARAGGAPAALAAPRLPSVRRQHEHSLAAIQDEAVRLAPGERVARGFFTWLEADHPAASSDADLALVERALALPEAAPPPAPVATPRRAEPPATLFSARPLFSARELDEPELRRCFGPDRRAEEREEGRLHSFFVGADAHVVLPAKERASLRPHGQILRSGSELVPDEASLTSTVWMDGVFHSMVTQGHVSINRLLSTTHGYLGFFRSHGQRIFVEREGGFELLGVPSAFEMTPSGARWIYADASGRFAVRSWAPVDRHELWLAVDVQEGPARRFLVSSHVAVNGDDGSTAVPLCLERDTRGVAVRFLPDTDLGRRFPEGCFRFEPGSGAAFARVGGDELLFADGRSRGQPFLTIDAGATRSFALRITGHLLAPGEAPPAARDAGRAAAEDAASAARYWAHATGRLDLRGGAPSPPPAAVAPLAEALPWFAHDALVHYLAPRGLEQYSGGGWGTRDVCQGPAELLLAIGRTPPLRDLLERVFRNQNPDGDWPQWFMFFERERAIRPGDSHGDIVFWPLLALADYLLASGDAAFLEAELPFFHPEGEAKAEVAPLLAHVDRALDLVARRVIPGTHLAAYGHGDWNDSLQPADPSLALRLCSSWTVTLHVQMFAALARALRRAGHGARADRLDAERARIRADFQRLLVVDDVLAGLVHFDERGEGEPWLHPRDREMGVAYSLLAMPHAILADLFTREQAARHIELIREHLLAPDGARLFDAPFPYHGGLRTRFQRAETSSYFGREIGIMYTHAHLRYAEAMARWGDAEALLLALRQACPVGLREVVPSARPRQANCYTSSSDADFADRYEALARYAGVRDGSVALEGGWRVYSSGAGIAVRLVRECLLGLRLRADELGVDPVLPRALDGLAASLEVAGSPLRVRYRVGARGFGPRSLALNGATLAFARAENPYREGGALVAMDALRARLRDGANELVVELG